MLTALSGTGGRILPATVGDGGDWLWPPSRGICRYDKVRIATPQQDHPALPSISEDTLWTWSVLFRLICKGDAYWTRYATLPHDKSAASQLRRQSGLTDRAVAAVELTQVPAPVPGMRRLLHLFALTRRLAGPVSAILDSIEGR